MTKWWKVFFHRQQKGSCRRNELQFWRRNDEWSSLKGKKNISRGRVIYLYEILNERSAKHYPRQLERSGNNAVKMLMMKCFNSARSFYKVSKWFTLDICKNIKPCLIKFILHILLVINGVCQACTRLKQWGVLFVSHLVNWSFSGVYGDFLCSCIYDKHIHHFPFTA